MRPEPAPPRSRSYTTFFVWLISVGVVILEQQALMPLVRRFHLPIGGILELIAFLAALVCISITLVWIALAIRWLLRKLFWRVGRRLFLSYVLVGVLPFFLMAILMLTIGYMMAGVMSQAALRGERQASLGQMESWSLEYGLTGKKPAGGLQTLEIYDTSNASGKKIPQWLRESTFSGMVWRGSTPILVTSRQMGTEEDHRSIVFAQPVDPSWGEQLYDRTGMKVRFGAESEKHHEDVKVKAKEGKSDPEVNIKVGEDEDADDWNSQIVKSIFRDVIWGDLTTLSDWDSGRQDDRALFTLIVIPVRNLFQFYFGTSGKYFRALGYVVFSLSVTLLIIYLMAALFAAVLIFSISRAVNRIEKGTKAVERGDFTYRIAMKPHNQLGEMAQSFDRMTESISTLLVTVAEKERLQSEIEIAASIQRNLLPKEGPQFRGVSFSAHFEPTASIGGDYYDVFNLDKTRLAVAIGDVSGHGLSTGLVMAMVKAAITTLVEEGADETSLFRRLNELVYRSTERRAFMTLAFTIFDLGTGKIRHTNAGHLYPYLLRKNGPPIAIESPSLPLGVRSDITTKTAEVDLEEGDTVVYLSDGIVEAQNAEGDPFGFEQLESLLERSVDRSPSAIRDAILEAVARHSGTRPADDDRTVMILRFDQFRPLLA